MSAIFNSDIDRLDLCRMLHHTIAGSEGDTVSAPDTNFLRYNRCLTNFMADRVRLTCYTRDTNGG